MREMIRNASNLPIIKCIVGKKSVKRSYLVLMIGTLFVVSVEFVSSFKVTNGSLAVSPEKLITEKSVKVSTSGYHYAPLANAPVGTNTLDIYECKSSSKGPCPVLVYLHGGGLLRGDKKGVGLMPELLNDKNFCLVSVNYPVFGRAVKDLIELQMSEIVAATLWLKNNLSDIKSNCTMNNAAIMGHSAGAYLAALLLVNSRYSIASDLYKTFIYNDSSWYGQSLFVKHKNSMKLIFGNKFRTIRGRESLRDQWIPSAVVAKSCPVRTRIAKVVLMQSRYRPMSDLQDNDSFVRLLNLCNNINASISRHYYNHKQMQASIGEPLSTTSVALINALIQ